MTAIAMNDKAQSPPAAATISLLWLRAYRTATANALLFLVLSMLSWALGVEALPIHIATCAIFFAGSVLSFWRLMRAGAELAAISFFVLGAGVFFGLGAAYAGIAPDPSLQAFFGANLLSTMFATVNLLNAASVVVVLLAAWPVCRLGPKRDFTASIQHTLDLLSGFKTLLFVIAFGVVFTQIISFPLPTNLILRTFLSHASSFTYVALLVSAMRWSRESSGMRVLAITLLFSMMLLGLLTTAKTTLLLPLISFGSGLLFDRKSRTLLVVLTTSGMISYFLFFAPICNYSRNHPIYSDDNSIFDRMQIVADTAGDMINDRVVRRRHATTLMDRFAATPIQAYLVERHDAGSPGRSLTTAWEALVPRIIWRNKPVITRFGPDLDRMVFRRAESGSSLAPSYSAEAYWNGGWITVLVVSMALGLELGWLTRKWNSFTREGSKHLGVLVLAVPIILSSFWVETWFVATYVGGFVTLVVLIKSTDMGATLIFTADKRPMPGRWASVRPQNS